MKRYLLGAAIGVMGAASAQAAWAQASSVEEVVVTAQRREQVAQDVGIALSVLGDQDLVRRGITSINQLQTATPNLEVEPAFGGGQAQFRLRGVGFQDYATNNTPTVGVYINEVAYPVPIMTQGLIFDMARVEVLRGPQGTLYGRNTTGGAVSFVTRKPQAEASGGASAEFGRFEALKAEAFVTGPLGSVARGRLAVATEQGGGFQYNRVTGEKIGDADRLAARGLADIDLGETAALGLEVHGGYDKSEAYANYLLNSFVTNGGLGVRIPADSDRRATGWRMSPTLARDTGLGLDAKPGRDNYTYGYAANLVWDLGDVKLTNIAAYDFLKRAEYGDWDATSSIEADTYFRSKVKVWSDELRLSSDTEGPLQWVAGVYVSKQRLREQYYSDFNDIFGTYARVLYSQLVKSASVFGQAEYAFNDQWKLIGGLRYEKETRELQGFGSAFGGAQALAPTTVKTDMSPVTGKISLEFKPFEQALVYVSASRGAKSGGFTTYNYGTSSGIEPFKSERLDAYEVGFKSNPTPELQINGAAYYYDYKDQQVLSAVWTANGPVGKFANAPKSEIYGAELEVVWRPVPGLVISQSASWKEGRYKEFFDLDIPASRAANAARFVDRADQYLPFPNWSYGGSVAYTWNLADYALEAAVDYSYRDKYPSWLGDKYDVDDYWLANVNLTLSPNQAPWTAAVWVRNVFDEEYDLTRNFFTSADIAQTGRPRTYGVRLTYNY